MIVADFAWTVPPSGQLVPNLSTYRERVIQGLHMLADLFASKMEGQAKAGAPWTDRTGAARQGLVGLAEKAAAGVVIYLIHSVHYGIYLELGTSRMAPRPILVPTLEANYGPIMAALRALVGG